MKKQRLGVIKRFQAGQINFTSKCNGVLRRARQGMADGRCSVRGSGSARCLAWGTPMGITCTHTHHRNLSARCTHKISARGT